MVDGWVGQEEDRSRDQPEVIYPTPSYLKLYLGVIFDQVRF